jgi:hypothetical protein
MGSPAGIFDFGLIYMRYPRYSGQGQPTVTGQIPSTVVPGKARFAHARLIAIEIRETKQPSIKFWRKSLPNTHSEQQNK